MARVLKTAESPNEPKRFVALAVDQLTSLSQLENCYLGKYTITKAILSCSLSGAFDP